MEENDTLAKKIASDGSTKTSQEIYDAQHGVYKPMVIQPNTGAKPLDVNPFGGMK